MPHVRRSRARFVAVLVTSALVAVACATDETARSATASSTSKADETLTRPAALATLLQGAGLQIVDTTSSPVDLSTPAVTRSREQVAAMAAQLGDHNGYLGADLDALAALGDPLPPMSYLLAGWASTIDAPGARAARSILGEQRWEAAPQIVWPVAVVDLFIADVIRDAPPITASSTSSATGAAATGARVVATPAALVGDACSAIRGFVDRSIAWIYAGIEAIASEADRVPVIGQILGAGVRLFGRVVKGVEQAIGTVTAAILAPVKIALEVLGTLDSLQTLLVRWGLTFEGGSPQAGHTLGVDAPGDRVDLTVKLSNTELDVPPDVRACAAAIDAPLPDKPGTGAPVTWDLSVSDALVVDLAEGDGADAVTNAERKATYHLQIGEETSEDAGGDPHDGRAVVRAKVARDDVEKLVKLAESILESKLVGLPTELVRVVFDVIAPLKAKVIAAAQALIGPGANATTVVPITYHTPAKPKPRPSSTTTTAPDTSTFCSAVADYERALPNSDVPGDGPSLESLQAALAAIPTKAPAPPEIATEWNDLVAGGLPRSLWPPQIHEPRPNLLQRLHDNTLTVFRWMRAHCSVASLHGWPIDAAVAVVEAGG